MTNKITPLPTHISDMLCSLFPYTIRSVGIEKVKANLVASPFTLYATTPKLNTFLCW